MNKRQKKKKLRKRIHPNIITEFIDKTTIDDILPSRDEILQNIAANIKKCIDDFKPSSFEKLPTIVLILMDDNFYILDENNKVRLYDIIFQEESKNE